MKLNEECIRKCIPKRLQLHHALLFGRPPAEAVNKPIKLGLMQNTFPFYFHHLIPLSRRYFHGSVFLCWLDSLTICSTRNYFNNFATSGRRRRRELETRSVPVLVNAAVCSAKFFNKLRRAVWGSVRNMEKCMQHTREFFILRKFFAASEEH